jgi:hypothetical protein
VVYGCIALRISKFRLRILWFIVFGLPLRFHFEFRVSVFGFEIEIYLVFVIWFFMLGIPPEFYSGFEIPASDLIASGIGSLPAVAGNEPSAFICFLLFISWPFIFPSYFLYLSFIY